MAKVNYVRHCITFAFFALINFNVTDGIGAKNLACKQVGNCRCIQLSGNGVDLSPLADYGHIMSSFLTFTNNQVAYFYHPCSDITLQSNKTTPCSLGTSLCFFNATKPSTEKLRIDEILKQTVNGTFYNLANSWQSTFQPSELEINLVFKSENVTTTINLKCDDSSNAVKTVIYPKDEKSIDIHNHFLVLQSPYSCYRNLSDDKHHMSGGAVFFLILIIIAAAYFFGGMLVLKYIKGATGLEMIPNYDFWVSLPSKVKSCCMRIKGSRSQETNTYESI